MDRYFNNDVIGIIETDGDYRVLQANPGASRMLGYTAEELAQRTWMDFTEPADVQKALDHFGPLFEQGHHGIVLEMRCRTKFGRTLDVALNVQARDRDANGKPQNYVAFLMDISRQKAAEKEVLAANRRVDDLHNKISRALGDTLGSRDPYTADHQNQVARLTDRIAVILGMAQADRRAVVAAASLHDIGKAAIPSEYLAKPGGLNDVEWAVIRTHATHGYEILKPMETEFPVAEIVYQHHERLDGSGYPRGLSNGSILREAQIVAAADTVDSIVNSRPYRRALSMGAAIEALRNERGTKIAEDIADACIAAARETA